MRSAYIIAVAVAVAATAQFAPPATPSERVAAELARSVQTFDANDPEVLVKRILAPKLRRFAVLHIANKTFATRRFLRTDKNQGLVVALAAAKRRGAVLPNVAWAHVEEASGGPKGRCPDSRVPTTVIAKRNGHAQCGILIPNPYFPDRHHHLKMGDLDRWARQAASIRKAARKRPVLTRQPRAFWRGKCLAGSYLKAPNFLVDPPALYSHKHARRARKRPGRRLAEASEPCLVRGAGARARLLAAGLTAARPDVVDAKCQVLAPPTNFSCARDRVALENALARVTNALRAVVDERWIEAEDYARHKFVLNLPGGTTGSYSRNLNRASAASERRGGASHNNPRRLMGHRLRRPPLEINSSGVVLSQPRRRRHARLGRRDDGRRSHRRAQRRRRTGREALAGRGGGARKFYLCRLHRVVLRAGAVGDPRAHRPAAPGLPGEVDSNRTRRRWRLQRLRGGVRVREPSGREGSRRTDARERGTGALREH